VSDQESYPLRVVLENRALALRPTTFGLPLAFSAILVSTSMMIGLHFNQWPAAFWFFFVGGGIGKIITVNDPFGLHLIWRSLRTPKMMRPS
jgi:hypothetical protein